MEFNVLLKDTLLKTTLYSIMQGWIYIWASRGCSPGAQGPMTRGDPIIIFIDTGGKHT